MLKVTTTGSHAGSQALTQHLHSHLVDHCNLPILSAMSNYRIIFEKKNCLLVCIINDVILLIRRCLYICLNLNEYRMPTGAVSV